MAVQPVAVGGIDPHAQPARIGSKANHFGHPAVSVGIGGG